MYKIKRLQKDESVERELLMKVEADASTRSEIVQIVKIFRANIIDVSKETLTIEISGSTNKVSALEDMLRQFGIKETVRTGTIALERGNKHIRVNNNDEE